MPPAVKTSGNMSKHLTKTERETRRQAEEEMLPQRRAKLKKPAFISGSKPANAYWNQILKRMDGLALLDDLDSEMLAGYCSMLARRDQTILLIQRLTDSLGVSEAAGGRNAPEAILPDELINAAAKLDALGVRLQTLDRTLLQYAEKLGLTPSGRVRLAQKRAQSAGESEPDGDLFGD